MTTRFGCGRSAVGFGIAWAMLAGVGVSGEASATEFESEARLFRFDDQLSVREDTYTLPLTVDLIANFLEGVGVEIELTGSAEVGVLLEGESQLEWHVEGQARQMMHEVRPLDDSSFINMVTRMQADVTLTGRFLGSNFSFTFASLPVDFEDEVSRFTPFLLPQQVVGPTSLLVSPEAGTGGAEVPLELVNASGGGGNLTLGLQLNVTPIASAEVKGRFLNTSIPQGAFLDTFSADGSNQSRGGVFPNAFELYDPVRELELSSSWDADIAVEIGYELKLSAVVTATNVPVVGTISQTVEIGSFEIPLFPKFTERVSFEASPDTVPWKHPLPLISLGADEVNFVDVPGNRVGTQSLAIANRGALDLQVEVSVEGSDQITTSPATLDVASDGSSSLVVSYTPDGPGSAEAVLVLRTSDPSFPEVRVPVRATAGEPADDDDLEGGSFRDTGSGTLVTCGCASSGAGPLGGWAAVVVLVGGLRRRR